MGKKEIIEDHLKNVELYLSPMFPESNIPLQEMTKDPMVSQHMR